MNNIIDDENKGNIYVILLLLVVSYFLINLLKKSKEYGDYLKIFATPEKMIINVIFILAIALWLHMPQYFGDDIKQNFVSFIFIIVSIGYTVIAIIGDLKNKMITEEDINNEEDKQKKSLYIISLVVYAIIMVFAIFLWGKNYIDEFGIKNLLIKFTGLISIVVILGGIIATRDKVNTVIDINIGTISFLLLILLQPIDENDKILNILMMFIWNVFIFYTLSFGFNFLVMSKKQGDYIIGQKVCHKLFDTPEDSKKNDQARIDDLAGEVNILKEDMAKNLTGKINTVQWVITSLCICFIFAIVLFFFLYRGE